MKLLFVLDQLPSPPRNGTTIPTYNYLTGLARHHSVSLLWVRDPDSKHSHATIEDNARLVDNLWELDAPKQGRLTRLFSELRQQSIYHIGREFDLDKLKGFLRERTFDAVWISNNSILDVITPLKAILDGRTIYIAGLNDSIKETFRGAIMQTTLPGLSLGERSMLASRWLRSLRFGNIEQRLLSPYNIIIVQSAKDRHMLNRISNNQPGKVMVLSNGVDPALFTTEHPHEHKRNLLFVGSLGAYSPLVEWLISQVWPTVLESFPDTTMTVIGRNATASLLKSINSNNRIDYIPFIEKLQDVYRGRTISVLPVRKGSGLINKVVESMAAGVPVIGDEGSFNALPDFKDGVHGIVTSSANQMAAAIIKLLDSKNERTRISAAARDLVHKHFSWTTRIDQMEKRLQTMLGQTKREIQ